MLPALFNILRSATILLNLLTLGLQNLICCNINSMSSKPVSDFAQKSHLNHFRKQITESEDFNCAQSMYTFSLKRQAHKFHLKGSVFEHLKEEKMRIYRPLLQAYEGNFNLYLAKRIKSRKIFHFSSFKEIIFI